ncbi:MAG: hypothetical protein ACHQSE_14455 [Gemmatimonadales bacterium]
MPYRFEFDRKNRILLTVVSGEFTDEEQLSINADIRRRAMVLKPVAGIGDMTGVTICSVTPAAVQIAARESSPYEAGTARFLVAPGDHVFGMSRMYQLTAKEQSRATMRVLRTREEALAELGVTDASFEPVCEESLTAQ